MKEMQRLLGAVRRAVDDYHMIAGDDHIAVGVSAGKDSLALLTLLATMRRFYPHSYRLTAITIDMGFPGADFSPVADFCASLDVPYIVVPTEIARIVFDERKEKNPCSLCANLRRGALHTAAKESGCNKLALGHHFDDAVETFMMNLFFEGRLGCFSPVTYLSVRNLTLLRPLLYAKEKDVIAYANSAALPVIKSPCPEDRHTEREEMKQLLTSLERENRGLRHRIFRAMCKGEIDGFRKDSHL